MRSQIWRIGLTGGIGSGKSTVAALLLARGAWVLDCDAIARACTLSGGAAMPEIARVFGPEFVCSDGSLNRQRMREHVFACPASRRLLEGIVHPLIEHEIRRLTSCSNAKCLVFDVPLLVQSPRWRAQLDAVVVVDCSPATQVRRVQARSGWDVLTIEAAIRNQSSREQRLAAADVTIFNDTDSPERLREEVEQLSQWFGI